jgi:hypothetical protein
VLLFPDPVVRPIDSENKDLASGIIVGVVSDNFLAFQNCNPSYPYPKILATSIFAFFGYTQRKCMATKKHKEALHKFT